MVSTSIHVRRPTFDVARMASGAIAFLRNPRAWDMVATISPWGETSTPALRIFGLRLPATRHPFQFTLIAQRDRFGRRRVLIQDVIGIDRDYVRRYTRHYAAISRWVRTGDDETLVAMIMSFKHGD